jgi:hypothetical protein
MSKFLWRALLWSPVALIVITAFVPNAVVPALHALPDGTIVLAFVALVLALAGVAGWHVVRRRRRGILASAAAGAAVAVTPIVATALLMVVLSAFLGRLSALDVGGWPAIAAVAATVGAACGALGGWAAVRRERHATARFE